MDGLVVVPPEDVPQGMITQIALYDTVLWEHVAKWIGYYAQDQKV